MRSLPERRNPHVAPSAAPEYDELVGLRRLNRTKLTVKPGQIGTSNATKEENLGPFEYAHLRAPLPEDLDDTEFFGKLSGARNTGGYFLMRRSKDGFVSASGMFKIAFPWATNLEEKQERDHLKALDVTSADEVAGNIWITAEYALTLGEEYGMTHWIRALLDPTEIPQNSTSGKKQITEPPKFDFPLIDAVKFAPPVGKTPQSRAIRSMSPAKGTPSKVKSPRKRQTKAQKEANLAQASAASASLQSALDDAVSVAESTPAPEASITGSSDLIDEALAVARSGVNGVSKAETATSDENVTVEVDQAVEVRGDTEVTHTNVTITMPAGLPELPLPEDTEAMLEKAKQMVEEARALDAAANEGIVGNGSPSALSKNSRKRKADDTELSDIDKELPSQPAKKAKVLEEKLKREKVRNRAIVGVTAMLGIAAAIPYFF